jgi:hypothetical protein
MKFRTAIKTAGLWLFLFSLPPGLAVDGAADMAVVGQVVRAIGGEPVPGAHVQAVGTTVETTSGPDGTFQLRLPGGEYRLEITAVGYARSAIDLRLPINDGEPVRIELEPEEMSNSSKLVTCSSVRVTVS